ncbi:MAG: hypothetical protein Q4D06_06110 [Coriobacteriia bacterium]|nr:hypothetical protein [Coriobacteriia bacterium]
MKYNLNPGSIEAVVETDPYIPLNIRFGKEDFEVDRCGIYGPDGELFEVAVSLFSNEIKELTLVHCERYHRLDVPLVVPTAESGVLSLEMPDHTDTPRFDVCVYSDGLRLGFTDDDVDAYLRHGNALFGIAKGKRAISEVILRDIDPKAIASMIETIDSTISQKDIVFIYKGDDKE